MGCFQIHRVRLLRSYLSADRLRMICLYHAPDAESVRVAQRQSGLPADRAWTAAALRSPGRRPAAPERVDSTLLHTLGSTRRATQLLLPTAVSVQATSTALEPPP